MTTDTTATTGTTAGTPRLTGRSAAETRSTIIDIIRAEGEVSRIDLARRTALTEATISKLVKSLLEDEIVVESGYAKSTGGKRPVLLSLNDHARYAIGVAIDVARCVCVLCGLDGQEIDRREIEGTRHDPPALVMDRIAQTLDDMLNARAISKDAVVGVGVAAGGRRGFSLGWDLDATFADEWEPYPVESELAARTGLATLRENDANCAALGEYWTTGNSTRDFATIYLAHGIGAGIIIGGTIYRGSSGNAGEIGHLLSVTGGLLCWCGRYGCLDTVASPRAVTQQIAASTTLRAACQVTDDSEFGEIYQRFGQLVNDGHAAATRLFGATIEWMAAAVLDLVNALDLDQIILAGPGFAQLGAAYRDAIQSRLDELALMRAVHPITVRLGRIGADAAALGAASVMLHRELTPHRLVAAL